MTYFIVTLLFLATTWLLFCLAVMIFTLKVLARTDDPKSMREVIRLVRVLGRPLLIRGWEKPLE
nr:hypothetical protein [Micromonospora sp. DSM 115978]